MIFRSEKLRRYVSSMTCVHCGSIDVQAAHRNQSKGMDAYILKTFHRSQLRRDLDSGLLAQWEAELRKAGMLEEVAL